jgi:hypothetical protein
MAGNLKLYAFGGNFMPSDSDSLVARAQSSYRKLTEAAIDLNHVSDSLGQMVGDLDLALKKLNLGLTVWIQVSGSDDSETYDYWSEQLGYAKINGKWGISLRTVKGNYQHPDRDFIETWLFNDGPRQLRLESIPYIPQLLEQLSEHAVRTTKQIAEKLESTRELITAVKDAASEPSRRPALRARPTGGEKQ